MSREEDLDQNMTVEDFAKWLLSLPKRHRRKQIWFIDITHPIKDSPLRIQASPTDTHISIEDADD